MGTRETVWAVSMMRDEADVAADVVWHLAEEGVDGIIVADNRSTDGTGDLLRDLDSYLPCDLIVVDDPEAGYYQSAKMTRLAERAAGRGASWVVPFDADEVWYAHSASLADALRALPASVRAVRARLYNHFCTGLDEGADSAFERLVWRQREPGALPKVAARWEPGLVIGAGNHDVTFPGPRDIVDSADVELRHFPYRSWEHFHRKAVNGAEAYAAAPDLAPELGAHWRQYGQLIDSVGADTVRAEVFDRYFSFLAPTTGDLVLDPAPFRRWRA